MPYRDNSKYDRRKFLKATGVAGAGLLAGCTGNGDGDADPDPGDGDADPGDGDGDTDEPAAEYPVSDVEFTIPFGPGGGYDYYGRIVPEYLPQYIDGLDTVQPQNVEGAGGQIAIENMWNADDSPSDHWIINMVNFGLTQLTNDVEWDLREFTYFSQVAEEFRGVAVGADSGIEDWDDYVEAVQNEEINFASTGPGSGYVTVPGVIGELGGLYSARKVMDNQVIYDGRGEAVQGILADDAQVMSGSYFSILDFVESGDVNMIMVCTAEDEPPEQTPDAETFNTVDMDNAQEIIDMLATRRIYAGTPNLDDDVAEMAQEGYGAMLQDDDLLADAEESDRPIVPADGEETAEAVQGFIDNWAAREDLLRILEDLDDDVEISA